MPVRLDYDCVFDPKSRLVFLGNKVTGSRTPFARGRFVGSVIHYYVTEQFLCDNVKWISKLTTVDMHRPNNQQSTAQHSTFSVKKSFMYRWHCTHYINDHNFSLTKGLHPEVSIIWKLVASTRNEATSTNLGDKKSHTTQLPTQWVVGLRP